MADLELNSEEMHIGKKKRKGTKKLSPVHFCEIACLCEPSTKNYIQTRKPQLHWGATVLLDRHITGIQVVESLAFKTSECLISFDTKDFGLLRTDARTASCQGGEKTQPWTASYI